MKNFKSVFRVVLFGFGLGSFLLVQSCQKEGCTNRNATNFDAEAVEDDGSCIYENGIDFNLDFLVDGDSIIVDEKLYKNAAGNEYYISRCHFYLSKIKLYYDDGSVLDLADFHYFDMLMPETHLIKMRDVDQGNLDSMSFIFGLRDELNQDYALPNDIENVNMQWPIPMGGGYHFMKFEGKFKHSSGESRNYNVHLGKLENKNGTSDPSFKQTFVLANVKITDEVLNMEIGMDLNRWFDGDKNYNMEDFGEGIMGNHEAQKLLKANGKDDVFKVVKTWQELY